MSRFLYIRRQWKTDEATMADLVSLNSDSSSRPFQIVLFPEGTNLTRETRTKSDAFAEKNNLPKLKHVLQPRTTGFSFLAEKMREGGKEHFD